jgi:hypothetical protein
MDLIGNYQLSLNGVSGMFNIVLLNSDDYIKVGDDLIDGFDELGAIDASILETIVNAKRNNLLSFNTLNNKFTFNEAITDCSIRFKYLLGIKSFPSLRSDVVASFNGSPYLFINTPQLSSLMRYSWQTKPEGKTSCAIKSNDDYAAVKNIVSVNLNTFNFNFPFSLIGSSFIADDSQLKEVNFTITGLHDEEILLTNDIIYNFTLNQLAPQVSETEQTS